MQTVKVSTKFRVVLPLEFRQDLGVKPGDKMAVQLNGKEIAFTRIRPLHELLGSLPGPNDFVREKKDREF